MAAFDETSKFCKHCNAQVVARRKGTNHVLHLLITLLLCGFWLPIWIGLAIKFGGWKCSRCGLGV